MAKAPVKKKKEETPVSVEVKEETSTAVAVKEDQLPVETEFLDELGTEEAHDFSSDDVALPRITLLQQLSPQLKKGDPNYIEGASAGEFCNPVTGELWDGADGLTIIPVHRHTTYVEWRLRSKGGGIIKDRSNESGIQEVWESIVPDENGHRLVSPEVELLKSQEYFVLLVDEDTGMAEEAVITLSKTNYKHAKKFNTLIATTKIRTSTGAMVNARMYAIPYRVVAALERKDNNEWYVWKFSRHAKFNTVAELPDGRNIFNRAKSFAEMIKEGRVQVAEPIDSGDIGDDTSGDPAAEEAF